MSSKTFNTQCPYCREPYVNFKIDLLGKKARCIKCGQVFYLTEQDEEDSLIKLSSNSSRPLKSESLQVHFQNGQIENLGSFEESAVDDLSSEFLFDPKKRPSKHPSISSVSLSFGEEFDEHIIKQYADQFPSPPPGVWKPGEILLNGMCQVLPLTPTQLYAEGGVGVVQRVRRKDWNVDLIVKSPKPGVVITESGKESFERECQTWIELGLHANIVSCYFVRRIDGIPRLFAEFAPDGTLRDWIADKRIYEGSPKEALARLLDISIQFAWGLEHAHSQGLLHLDVKPGNVMTAGNTIKVTDFGLSKFATESGELGGSVGNLCEGMTPSYCSPEQYEAFQIYKKLREEGRGNQALKTNIPMTKQSDIWSWGISILSMFHGRSPCKRGGQTAAEVFEVFLKSQTPGPRPLMPTSMVDLLRSCFKKQPADRPESMQYLADQLVNIYEEEIGVQYPRRQPRNAALTAESFSNKAISLIDLGRTDEALGLLKEAVDLEPGHPLILFNRELALWRCGKIKDSHIVKKLEENVQNRPLDPQSTFVVGLTQIERGNIKSAISSFERVLELNPQRNDIRKALQNLKEFKAYDSTCLTQYVLKKSDEHSIPSLFLSENEETLLVELAEGKYALLNSFDGKPLIKFTPSKPTTSKGHLVTAISEDFKWTLTFYPNQTAIIQPASLKQTSSQASKQTFYQRDWKSRRNRKINRRLQNLHSSSASLVDTIFYQNETSVFLSQKNAAPIQITNSIHSLTTFVISQDGNWLVTGNDSSEIELWNIPQRRCVRTFFTVGSTVEALCLDAQNRYILSLSKGNCCQFFSVQLICNNFEKIQSPHQLCQINSSEELLERQNRIQSLLQIAHEASLKRDVSTIVSAFHNVQVIDGWETCKGFFDNLLEKWATRARILELTPTHQIPSHDGIVSALSTSWNGSFVVSAGKDSEINVWRKVQDAASPTSQRHWELIRKLEGHSDWIRSISLSPNNRYLASASWDQYVFLWDLASGKIIRTMPDRVKDPTKVQFSPDGQSLALASAYGAVNFYNLDKELLIGRQVVGNGAVHSVVYSRDGLSFWTSTDDGFVRFWSKNRQYPSQELSFNTTICSLDVSFDSRLVVAGGANGKIHVEDLCQNTRFTLPGHLGEVTYLKLFGDANWLISTGKDKTLRLWNLQKQKTELKIANLDGEITSLALDLKGLNVFTGSANGVIKCWVPQWDYQASDVTLQSRDQDFQQRLDSLIRLYASTSLLPDFSRRASKVQGPTPLDQAPSLNETLVQRILREAKIRGIQGIPTALQKKYVIQKLAQYNS